MLHIPFSVEQNTCKLSEALTNIIRKSGGFVRGEKCNALNSVFVDFCGAKSCLGIDGDGALTLILKGYMALGRLKKGDGVIMPSNANAAIWYAVSSAGLIPVLAEPSRASLLIDAISVQKAYERNEDKSISAIVAQHLNGRVCEMGGLRMFAKYHNLVLLEEASNSLGAYIDDRTKSTDERKCGVAGYSGSLGDAASFSFKHSDYGVSIVAANDLALTNAIYNIGFEGLTKKADDQCLDDSNSIELQISDCLENYLEQVKRKREIAERYLTGMQNELVRLPNFGRADQNGLDNVWHIFAVHSPRRDALREHLKRCNIDTQIHYPIPPHLQGAFKGTVKGSFPIAEQLALQELSLPLHPFLTDEEIERIIQAINSFEN